MRKIGIGLNWQGAFNLADAVEQAKVADDSGVDHLMVAEAWGRDAFTTMAIIGYETNRIRIGTSIINVFSRTPGAVAQQFSSLDSLTDGRMIIGLGSSGPQVIEHFHGVPFDRPMRRIREYVEIINMLLAGEPLHYQGKIFNLDRGFTLRHLDELPRRHIPIFIGAFSEKSVRQTAAIADGWLPGHTTRDRWKEEVSTFHQYVRDAGRDPADIEIKASAGVEITDRPEEAYDRIRQHNAFYMARMGDLHYNAYRHFGLGEVADEVRRAWREHGSAAAYAAVPDDVVHSLGYAGSVEGAIDWMEEQRDAGYTLHGVTVNEPDTKKRAAIFRQLVG
jgi:F420-dependent oxidoreductase-like protein